MKINRIICLALIIVCGVFASYYGGNISYALFYLAIFLPITSFLYTVYVYARFKIYQSLDNYLVVKGDWIPYAFVVANEDYVTFRNIKVNFLKDKSTIEAADQVAQYSLLPNESERLKTRLKCNYRGEYYIGVDSIEVTDFLYLFTITYPIGTKLKATVLPRIVPIDRLVIAPSQSDVKNPLRFSNTAEEELDTEVRKYLPGDSRKKVHWKLSARMQELISRKYQYIPKAQIAIFMDLRKPQEEELKVVITEDKIIESVLGISNYYATQRTTSHIIYEMGERMKVTIRNKEEFNAFYKTCAKIYFRSQLPVQELILEYSRPGNQGVFCVVVTHLLSKELYVAALNLVQGGSPVTILFVSDDITQETKDLISGMKASGISVYQIMSEDEIGEVLTKGTA